jgi:thymidylate kinase
MDERGQVAQALFDRLYAQGTAFCVLGDVRGYLETISSDIDIAVPPREFARMPDTISRFCRDLGLRLVQMLRHERSACYYVIAWQDAYGTVRYLAPDFCSDYRRGGRLLLRSQELLNGRRKVEEYEDLPRDFMVPAPDVQFAYYLIKRIDKLEIGATHGEFLSRQWHADPDGALRRMVRFWPALADNGLIAQAATANEWAGVRAALPRLRLALRRAVRLQPLELLAEAGRALERVLRPTGMTVAFLGPDGSGKSSVIERVSADLAPAFRRTRQLHLRPRLLAPGRREPVTAPHALPPRDALASTAKLGLFVADYLAGYLLRVRPATVRSTLVAYDRYYHDLLADPLRYRYGGAPQLARAFAALVPAPDLWFLLDAPELVLQERKQEVTPPESEMQRRSYLTLATQLRDPVVLDATGSLPEVAMAATQAILAWLENRVERRYLPRSPDNPRAARLLLFCCRHPVPLLGGLVRLLLNSEIDCPVRSAILMPYPYGIVIDADARIGSGVTVMQQVTIGRKSGGDERAPVIGDGVFIGAGAKLLGPIQVGHGAIIGANAVVTRDVPSYCTVIGANRILRKFEPADNDDAAPTAGPGLLMHAREY